MTQPAPGYQPYQPLPPMIGYAAPPKPSGGGLTSLLAGILALLTAGIAVGASFAPITTLRDSFEADGDPFVDASKSTWWSTSYDGSSDPFDDQTTLVGLTLVLVAALLVLGAVFAFVASRTRMSGPTTGGRSLISAGVGVLAGVTLLQVLAVVEQASRFNDRDLRPGESLDYKPGLGLILPLCALGLGLVAVVLVHVGQRPRAARVEPNTPRMGFPAPYGYRPGMPVPPSERPTDVEAGSSASQEEIDDAEDTQIVSNAMASGAEPPAPVTDAEPPAEATPPAPVTPATTSETPPISSVAAPAPATSGHTAPQSDPTPEDPAPVTPATTSTPGTPTDGDTAAGNSAATPEAPSENSAPAPEAPAGNSAPTSEAPAGNSAPAPEAPAGNSATPSEAPAGDAPATPSQAEPSPFADLPAAPPAPELSAEKKDDK